MSIVHSNAAGTCKFAHNNVCIVGALLLCATIYHHFVQKTISPVHHKIYFEKVSVLCPYNGCQCCINIIKVPSFVIKI